MGVGAVFLMRRSDSAVSAYILKKKRKPRERKRPREVLGAGPRYTGTGLGRGWAVGYTS